MYYLLTCAYYYGSIIGQKLFAIISANMVAGILHIVLDITSFICNFLQEINILKIFHFLHFIKCMSFHANIF